MSGNDDTYADCVRGQAESRLLLPDAAEALSALAQPSRLAIFRLLVRSSKPGLAAGMIAADLGIAANTLSTHLAILSRAGLVRSRREGRSIIYSADHEGMRALLAFLIEDCCDGRPDICLPLDAAPAGCGRP